MQLSNERWSDAGVSLCKRLVACVRSSDGERSDHFTEVMTAVQGMDTGFAPEVSPIFSFCAGCNTAISCRKALTARVLPPVLLF